MKQVVISTAAALIMAVAGPLPSTANATMQLGNYDLLTNRYLQSSWVWFIANCSAQDDEGCAYVSARPRRNFYASYHGSARLIDGRYTMTVDVPDGLRCPAQALPTRETYSWDPSSLVGVIEARYDVGCFNGPAGTVSWTFALQRL